MLSQVLLRRIHVKQFVQNYKMLIVFVESNFPSANWARDNLFKAYLNLWNVKSVELRTKNFSVFFTNTRFVNWHLLWESWQSSRVFWFWTPQIWTTFWNCSLLSQIIQPRNVYFFYASFFLYFTLDDYLCKNSYFSPPIIWPRYYSFFIFIVTHISFSFPILLNT